MRTYLAYCQLEYHREDDKYDKYQLVLVGILTTLCSTSRNDFLIFNKKMGTSGDCELWRNGMQLMKDCYCRPGIKLDKIALIKHRDTWIGRMHLWYDSKRGVPRNTQNPGNYSPEYQRPNHFEETAKWKANVGLRVSSSNKAIAPAAAAKRKNINIITTNLKEARATDAKAQRKKSIDEGNKWGVGNLRIKGAAAAAKRSPCTIEINSSRQSKEAIIGAPQKSTPPIPKLLQPPQTHRSNAHYHQQQYGYLESITDHNASLAAIRRNAELEEARIIEEKRIRVLREDSEREAARTKQIRQLEELGK